MVTVMRRLGDRTHSVGAHRVTLEPGEPLFETRPGDFVLVKRPRDLFADSAVFGNWLFGARGLEWNHAAVFTGTRGQLVHATREGVKVGHVGEFHECRRMVVTVLDNVQHRRMAAEHAETLVRPLEELEMLRVCARMAAGRGTDGFAPAEVVAACLRVCSVPISPKTATLADLLAL
jgi:hypothetical protein